VEGLTAIIGGTGLTEIDGLFVEGTQSIETPYGDPASEIKLGNIEGSPVVFLARHGIPHHLPPHLVNYRANIWALKSLNVARIIAVNAVGSIHPELELADLVVSDQIIDYTYGRDHTFFEESAQHIDFTFPFDDSLRAGLNRSASSLADKVVEDKALLAKAGRDRFGFSGTGTYGCTQGPRLETAAEIMRMKRDGCDVVGMTCMPEASLAREIELPYVSISMVVNKAAGIDGDIVTLEDITAVLEVSVGKTMLLIAEFLRAS
jgi:5'-methylthioinosine phosphorylase